MNHPPSDIRRLFQQTGLSVEEIAEKTEISRQTWSKIQSGKSRLRRFHVVLLEWLKGTGMRAKDTAPREPWQRLAFPAPRCEKCRSKMHRVSRRVVNGKTQYAWRCRNARKGPHKGLCDYPRIWTDDQGHVVQKPSPPIKRSPRVGVRRHFCKRCGRPMDSIEKKSEHLLFGPLWKWRCTGTVAKPHKSYEMRTDYPGNEVQLPRIRRWGTKLLPFEVARIKNLPADCGPARRLAAIERCENCGRLLEADRLGPKRWRMVCPGGCGQPFVVDDKGRRVQPRRGPLQRDPFPQKARNCPVCRRRLSLSGTKWRARRLIPHSENLIRLVCAGDGKRRHRNSVFYFDTERNKFLSPQQMQPGQSPGECPVRRRCCGKKMWASWNSATAREPGYWFLTCANPACRKGRKQKRRYLKVLPNGKCLPWLKRPATRQDVTTTPLSQQGPLPAP